MPGFLSGLGRMFGGGGMRQPRINDFGKMPGGMGGGFGVRPVADQPYLGAGGNPMEALFGGSPAPDWSQAMGKPGGGFGLGQIGKGAGAMAQMMGQQEQQPPPYSPSWFGQFQPFGRF